MFQSEAGESALSVERLAEQYVEQIQKARPHGPYVIGGVCFGGLVAYEMARQLTVAGHKVEQTILMETVLPHAYRRRLGKLIRDLSRLPLIQGERSIASRIVRKVLRSHSSREVRSGNFTAEEQAQLEEARVRQLRDRIQNNAMADYASRIDPLSSNVIAIRALDEPVGEGYEVEKSGGFAPLAPTQTHFVRGTHLGILAEPNVDALARILTQLLKGE